jgi:hypothetical protein
MPLKTLVSASDLHPGGVIKVIPIFQRKITDPSPIEYHLNSRKGSMLPMVYTAPQEQLIRDKFLGLAQYLNEPWRRIWAP